MKRDRRYDDISEKDWQAQVIELLGYAGWRVAHFRSMATRDGTYLTAVAGDGVGFPDLFAIHPKSGDRFAAELKAERGRPTPAQLQWLAWFETAGIDAYIWRPSQVDEVIARVQQPSQENVNAIASPNPNQGEPQ